LIVSWWCCNGNQSSGDAAGSGSCPPGIRGESRCARSRARAGHCRDTGERNNRAVCHRGSPHGTRNTNSKGAPFLDGQPGAQHPKPAGSAIGWRPFAPGKRAAGECHLGERGVRNPSLSRGAMGTTRRRGVLVLGLKAGKKECCSWSLRARMQRSCMHGPVALGMGGERLVL
jgi:hypothetical protein